MAHSLLHAQLAFSFRCEASLVHPGRPSFKILLFPRKSICPSHQSTMFSFPAYQTFLPVQVLCSTCMTSLLKQQKLSAGKKPCPFVLCGYGLFFFNIYLFNVCE